MRRITHSEFAKEFNKAKERYGFNFSLVGKYIHSHIKIEFDCPIHGSFKRSRGAILNGMGCLECMSTAREKTRGKNKNQQYLRQLQVLRIKPLGKFKGLITRIRHRCLVCDGEWTAMPSTVLKNSCPHCNGNRIPRDHKISVDEFQLRLKNKHPTIAFDRKTYKGSQKEVRCTCKVCKTVWNQIGNLVTKSRIACPTCREARDRSIYPPEHWLSLLKEKHGNNVKLVGQYRGVFRKHRFKCYTCLGTWKSTLYSVAKIGTGCHHCARKINQASQGKYKFFSIHGKEVRVQGYEPQAITWLLQHRDLKIDDLVLDTSGGVPVIPYRIGRRNHNYYPDIYIPKLNRIVEVKSFFTFGIDSKGKRGWKDWLRNVEKAKAVMAAGYRFTLLLVDSKGTRYFMPSNWHTMKRNEVLFWLANNSADASYYRIRKPVHLKKPFNEKRVRKE